MSTSEEIPPSAKDWVKSSALYPFSPFCWHLLLLLSSVSCSTSRCVVCFLLHVTYNLLTSASYTPRDLQSTSGIDSHHNLLWRSPAYNGNIFFPWMMRVWISKYSFVFRIICGCSLFSYTFDKLSVTRKWSIYPYVFLCTFKPEHVYVTIYVKSWSINKFLSKNLLLPTVCLILFWELITTLRDGLNLLT